MSAIELPAHVSVTAEHIGRGEPDACESCPIALALAEAIDALGIKDASVSVYCERVVVAVGADAWSATLPDEAQAFIGRFDTATPPVEPFEFDLSWREGNES